MVLNCSTEFMGVIVQIVNDVEIEFQSAYAVFMLICAPYYNFLLL